ncbi:MAG TPA: helix-turn-helix domain-containing protein [Catalimonadaceae bacterium]|jgi:DNA-binding HxlR family transcriptional regulator|nr:helix-turn-helix domain-containing protein [Catalimonadaceae bacterium]
MPDVIIDRHIFHNPVEFALSKIGGTYKMPILWRLKDKTWRYSELKKSLKHVSDRMLSKALKELEQDGFINRQVFAEVPPKVEYGLTERGKSSIQVIETLRNYGMTLMNEFEIPNS